MTEPDPESDKDEDNSENSESEEDEGIPDIGEEMSLALMSFTYQENLNFRHKPKKKTVLQLQKQNAGQKCAPRLY